MIDGLVATQFLKLLIIASVGKITVDGNLMDWWRPVFSEIYRKRQLSRLLDRPIS
jgi:hypothetical protein